MVDLKVVTKLTLLFYFVKDIERKENILCLRVCTTKYY